ncbi:VWA domain-containing protein [Streptomyces sp. HNM0663]|uniref:VWA domain-containing protein n=1 Tax=Streptomyces chengmaiensis TaxID=3040919 RepID=A0ABT6HPE8_9ACTN|nr:VWA domain-containing protein [Streptomyces chengmaiensis]MDH2390598.1 VWA domain-containing protein [Streptomyces chengmaiensis]
MDAVPELTYDEQRADALVTVTGRSTTDASHDVPGAEVLIMDRSLSMNGGKLDEAKRAMCAAIDTLRDGTYLGIVAGNHKADVIFPADGGLARVDATAREDAKLRVIGQPAEGGTAMGQWLTCARELFASAAPGAVRHAVLYTDGKDEHETEGELAEILTSCVDRFVCDARGLGDDWHYAELLRITEALHGTAEAVLTITDLTEDFSRLMRQAQRILVPRVYLGLRLNHRFQLAFVRQTRPVEAELTVRPHGDEIHVPLGSWSPETRQYQVSLHFDPHTLTPDEKLRAARITLHAERPDGTRLPCSDAAAMVVRRLSTPGFGIPRSANLTRVENERELGMAMRACADAHLRGDLPRADDELRLATGLAEDLQDLPRLQLLRTVAATGPDGRLRVRRDVSRAQIQKIGVDSTKTAGPPVEAAERPVGNGPSQARVCPRCSTAAVSVAAKYCEECRYRFEESGANDGPVDAR